MLRKLYLLLVAVTVLIIIVIFYFSTLSTGSKLKKDVPPGFFRPGEQIEQFAPGEALIPSMDPTHPNNLKDIEDTELDSDQELEQVEEGVFDQSLKKLQEEVNLEESAQGVQQNTKSGEAKIVDVITSTDKKKITN